MRQFNKAYPSVRQSAVEIRRDAEGFAAECGFSDLEVADIKLAVGEAATNAIEHGHVPGSTIEVESSFDSNELWISIEDFGGGLATSEKTWMRAVHKIGQGGFGLLIMKNIMDDVRLAPIPGDGAKLVMRKRRTDDDSGVARR